MTNQLASSTSPYLRQHADNPVHWHEWGERALALARENDKPILLSIGYSACHWCHVMAHESFEDSATAAVMNDLFVNIKVDREERPDLDKIYQLAHQALTGRGGGWPLTVFLTPDDLLPFYAGTYFPPEPRHGMPPFNYVLQQVRAFWDTRRDDVRAQNASLLQFLADAPAPSTTALDDAPITRALSLFTQHFDAVNGGHVGAPKFPHCGELELLRETHSPVLSEDRRTALARTTLDAMVQRGLYDHLGGGFFRYCVDARWAIPHFEKMLYDNAQLLPLYADAAVRLGEGRYRTAVTETVAWLQREMRAPGGACYATLDADSEGEEGKFYVWQREEVQALLNEHDFAVAERRFGMDRPPNFEQHHWHLHRVEEAGEIARLLGRERADVEASLTRSRDQLMAARDRRIRPGRDDKILTAWNALLASGLLRAARSLQDEELAGFAAGMLDFVRAELWVDQRLFACYAGGRAQFPAYLDDHAFLLDALIERLQWRWDDAALSWARELADALLGRFQDDSRGGFFFTARDHEALPHRPRPFFDESLPSGNGVAARALLRLGHLLGETRYLAAAERTLRAAWQTLLEMPQGCAALLRALNDALNPRAHLIVRAPAADLEQWRAVLDPVRDAHVDAYFIDSTTAMPAAVPTASDSVPQAAWLCVGTRCLAPLLTPQALREHLQRGIGSMLEP